MLAISGRFEAIRCIAWMGLLFIITLVDEFPVLEDLNCGTLLKLHGAGISNPDKYAIKKTH
jgi:hypothetical protein